MKPVQLATTLTVVTLSTIMTTQPVSAKEGNGQASAQSSQRQDAPADHPKAKAKMKAAKPATPSAARTEFRKLEKPVNESEFRVVKPQN